MFCVVKIGDADKFDRRFYDASISSVYLSRENAENPVLSRKIAAISRNFFGNRERRVFVNDNFRLKILDIPVDDIHSFGGQGYGRKS